jgi:hypothetical protein
MGKDTSDIRAEIEETRMRVGEEVDALSYKTDVGARAGDYVHEKTDAVKSTVAGARDAVTGVVTKPIPSRRQLESMRDGAERNPLGLAVGGAALGFVVGLLIPSTRVENEQLGELSDRVVDATKETASEAVERGRHVAEEAGRAAMETAREAGRDEGQQLASHLQERAQQAAPDEPRVPAR